MILPFLSGFFLGMVLTQAVIHPLMGQPIWADKLYNYVSDRFSKGA